MSVQLNLINCFNFNQSETAAHHFLPVFLSGDHTKALIGQLIIFNQILGELRQDIREQVSVVSSYVSADVSSDVSSYVSSGVSSGEGDGSDQEQHPGVSGLW